MRISGRQRGEHVRIPTVESVDGQLGINNICWAVMTLVPIRAWDVWGKMYNKMVLVNASFSESIGLADAY